MKLAPGMALKLYSREEKGFKRKTRKCLGLTATLGEITEGKLGGGPFWFRPILNRVNKLIKGENFRLK